MHVRVPVTVCVAPSERLIGRDGPIGRRKRGYILTANRSDGGAPSSTHAEWERCARAAKARQSEIKRAKVCKVSKSEKKCAKVSKVSKSVQKCAKVRKSVQSVQKCAKVSKSVQSEQKCAKVCKVSKSEQK
eukprot:1189319-Prorocentrum_minimum.AAC.1